VRLAICTHVREPLACVSSAVRACGVCGPPRADTSRCPCLPPCRPSSLHGTSSGCRCLRCVAMPGVQPRLEPDRWHATRAARCSYATSRFWLRPGHVLQVKMRLLRELTILLLPFLSQVGKTCDIIPFPQGKARPALRGHE
jgi:hypothetical protein